MLRRLPVSGALIRPIAGAPPSGRPTIKLRGRFASLWARGAAQVASPGKKCDASRRAGCEASRLHESPLYAGLTRWPANFYEWFNQTRREPQGGCAGPKCTRTLCFVNAGSVLTCPQ